MNAHVEALLRPMRADAYRDGGGWLGATAAALALATVAAIALPGVLVLPAVALGLFAASLLPMLLTTRSSAPARERARLFAAMLFAFGIGAAAFGDLNAVATYLG